MPFCDVLCIAFHLGYDRACAGKLKAVDMVGIAIHLRMDEGDQGVPQMGPPTGLSGLAVPGHEHERY